MPASKTRPNTPAHRLAKLENTRAMTRLVLAGFADLALVFVCWGLFQRTASSAFVIAAGCRILVAGFRVASHFRHQRRQENAVLRATEPEELEAEPTKESVLVTVLSWVFYILFLVGAFRGMS